MTGHAPADRDAALVRLERSLADFQAAYRDVLRDAATGVHPDLQPMGFKLLATISRRGPVGAGEAAEALHSDPAVVSRLTKELHRLGLVTVDADPRDRRSRIISLTATAEERLAPLRGSGRSLLSRSLDGWTAEELEDYADFNERLVRSYRATALGD